VNWKITTKVMDNKRNESTFILLSSQTNGVSKSLKTKTRTELELGARCWWLTSVILATQEAEIRKLVFKASPDK
jgi:hypothetical protein